jgi:hypothetical protein
MTAGEGQQQFTRPDRTSAAIGILVLMISELMEVSSQPRPHPTPHCTLGLGGPQSRSEYTVVTKTQISVLPATSGSVPGRHLFSLYRLHDDSHFVDTQAEY